MQEQLLQIKNEAMSQIMDATKDEIEQIYINYLGKKGKLTLTMREIPNLSIEERSEIGRLANEIKNILDEQINDKRRELATIHKEKKRKAASFDVTLPGEKPPVGSLHLVTQAIEEITSIFSKIGFSRVRYPEVEFDWYAFGALNFPDNHPARDDWETFFVDLPNDTKKGAVLLTPHTSSGQIREMERAIKEQDPNNISIRMLNIAKCYRRQSDVSHTQMFHQFEGLVVGKNITIAHLKGVLEYFVKSYFGEKRTFRIRPYHFQFTEPSFEIDVTCGVCNGKGCRLCKAGWLEMGGSGMVHPNVLKACGLDHNKYTGFAFGWGVERVLMMKEGLKIDDLRILYGNDLNFLKQF